MSVENHQHEIKDVNHLREELDANTTGMSEMASNTSQAMSQLLTIIENLRKTVDILQLRVNTIEQLLGDREARWYEAEMNLAENKMGNEMENKMENQMENKNAFAGAE